jgi:peptide-methionine (R)-S-oxide reductase
MELTDEELKKKLTPEQYKVLREKGTEAPFSGEYVNHKEKGMYTCVVCGAELFSSDTKFDSKAPGLQGWPSFYDVAKSDAVKLNEDNSHGMHRIEVTCANCGSHLGHFFEDVPGDEHGVHYCINSACLAFAPKDDSKQEKANRA